MLNCVNLTIEKTSPLPSLPCGLIAGNVDENVFQK